MTDFIPGLQLNEAYYWEVVRPILDTHFPNLAHSAGLIGYGSDVIGFDTPVSRDHQWGPRLVMFLPPEDFAATAREVDHTLRHSLPYTFRGYSTNYSDPDLERGVARVNAFIEQGPVNHQIQLYTIDAFWRQELGISPFQDPDSADWLTFQEHRLLTLTTGKVYFDGLGLEAIRRRFAYYPVDVWLYLLATQWGMISQEEAFVGRASQVGDELGSRIIAARLVERLMRLCFLMEKRYAPYSKWFGTGFRRLDCYPRMGPLLKNALAAADFSERDRWLSQTYTLAAELHNGLGITPPLEPSTRNFSDWHQPSAGEINLALDDPRNTRPFQVLFASRFKDAIYAQIQDPTLLSALRTAGSVNQFLVESSDALQDIHFCRSLKDDLIIR
jgi:hypothetical protein